MNKGKSCEIRKIAKILYENQPECFTAIAKERRAEASYKIAKAIYSMLMGEKK